MLDWIVSLYGSHVYFQKMENELFKIKKHFLVDFVQYLVRRPSFLAFCFRFVGGNYYKAEIGALVLLCVYDGFYLITRGKLDSPVLVYVGIICVSKFVKNNVDPVHSLVLPC